MALWMTMARSGWVVPVGAVLGSLVAFWLFLASASLDGTCSTPFRALYRLSDGQQSPSPRHPILDLIDSADRKWRAKVAAQTLTLPDAVAEYRRRYGRRPPKGFDAWWQWSASKGVQLLDEYDSLYASVEPFFALPPDVFRQRVEALTTGKTRWDDDIVVIKIENHVQSRSHPDDQRRRRADEILELLRPVAHLLPDMNIPLSYHDFASILATSPLHRLHVDHARSNTFLAQDQLDLTLSEPGFEGWPDMCPSDSPLRRRRSGLAGPSSTSSSFIAADGHVESMNVCRHPDLLEHVGVFYGRPRADLYWPLFSFAVPKAGCSSIRITPMSQFKADVGPDPDWDAKPGRRLYWRGSSSGAWSASDTNWRTSQRYRLLAHTTGHGGGTRPLRSPTAPGDRPEVNVTELAQTYYDVALTGEPIQCAPETCRAITASYLFRPWSDPEESNQAKYVLDVDGNGWSGRFRRLMRSKSVVLKSTIFPEWYSDRVQPWLHYVPVRVDYQDLDDTMAFFTGDLDGAGAHDDLGRRIGQAGKDWAESFWRMEDMQAYMVRLLLEYDRLLKRTLEDPTLMDLH